VSFRTHRTKNHRGSPPAVQFEQTVAPALADLPEAQDAHVEFEVAPISAEKVPNPQGEQEDWPPESA